MDQKRYMKEQNEPVQEVLLSFLKFFIIVLKSTMPVHHFKTVPDMKKVPCHSHSSSQPYFPTVLLWARLVSDYTSFDWFFAEEVSEIKGGASTHYMNGQESLRQQTGINQSALALFLNASFFSKLVESSSSQVLLPQVIPLAARAYSLILLIPEPCSGKGEPNYYWLYCFILLSSHSLVIPRNQSLRELQVKKTNTNLTSSFYILTKHTDYQIRLSSFWSLISHSEITTGRNVRMFQYRR